MELLDEKGIQPDVIEYLNTPPNREELKNILDMLALEPRQLMRKGESEYKDNKLDDESLSAEELIEAMIKFPRLIERPIVISNGKAAIGRPPSLILDII
jgi:arsenate reductase (glutaredoxin)